ncbi:MAG: hypothetical protein ACT4P7_07840 [Gemmatimonadaceae bacterium]
MTSPLKPSAPLSKAEFTALSTIAKARQDNLQAMFKDSKIVYGKTSAAGTAKSVVSAGKTVFTNAKKLASGGATVSAAAASSGGGLRAQAEKLILDAVGVDQIGDLISVITNEAVEELVKEMMPYVGIIMSSYKAANAWKQVVQQARKELGWEEYTSFVLEGDPLAACAGVRTILRRNIARDTVQATIHTTAVATKIAGLAGDFGSGATTTVIGLASGLASLAVELTQLGIDISEMRAGNKRLAKPASLDRTIFRECPLVGSYLIAYSPASMLLNFFVADIGLPGWMDKIELFKKQGLDPIIETAEEQIKRSRISIVGFQTGKGQVADKSIGDKLASLNYKNLKFQFNRVVRSKLPF